MTSNQQLENIWNFDNKTCIDATNISKRLIRPPLEPKNENCFSPISSYLLCRRITQVKKSGIYSNFTVVIVTKMATKIGFSPTGVYLLDLVCSGSQFYIQLSPYLCFISFLYLALYVLGDDVWISTGFFMQTKYLCVLIHLK